jgi:hypothetical protein
MRVALAYAALALLVGCGTDAGVRSVTVDLDGVEVTCHVPTADIDPAQCRQWGAHLIREAPGAPELVITAVPSGVPCHVEALDALGDVLVSIPNAPCRGAGPNASGDGGS